MTLPPPPSRPPPFAVARHQPHKLLVLNHFHAIMLFAFVQLQPPEFGLLLWVRSWDWANISGKSRVRRTRVRRTHKPAADSAVITVAVMARKIQQLTALAVTRASKQGLYPDGAGLYLRVGRGGAKSWAFRFMLNGKAREMGLGGLAKVGLPDARKKATDARLLLSDGRDPITHRQEEETRRAADEKLAAARSVTFDKCAEAYISAHEASWRNKKHRQQWRSTLTTYVSPVFGSVPVQDVDVNLIIKVIEPLWSEKTETARRVRGRVEVILDWAKVRGYRSGENSARWRGHLDHLLPARSKVRVVKHHAALPTLRSARLWGICGEWKAQVPLRSRSSF